MEEAAGGSGSRLVLATWVSEEVVVLVECFEAVS